MGTGERNSLHKLNAKIQIFFKVSSTYKRVRQKGSEMCGVRPGQPYVCNTVQSSSSWTSGKPWQSVCVCCVQTGIHTNRVVAVLPE